MTILSRRGQHKAIATDRDCLVLQPFSQTGWSSDHEKASSHECVIFEHCGCSITFPSVSELPPVSIKPGVSVCKPHRFEFSSLLRLPVLLRDLAHNRHPAERNILSSSPPSRSPCCAIAALLGLLDLLQLFKRYFRYWYDHLLMHLAS